MTDDDPPDPPASLPQYVVDAVERQDITTLRRIIAYSEQLADLTPKSPLFTDDFDVEQLKAGDIIRHTSSKSTVSAEAGQVARVLGDEAVEIWDDDGTIQTVRTENITAVAAHSAEQSDVGRFTDTHGTDVGREDADSNPESDSEQ